MQKRHSATRIRCRGASTFAAWDRQENLKQKRDCGYRAEPGYENAGVPVRGFPLALLAERLPALRQPLMLAVVFEPPATHGTVAATPRNRWIRPGE